MMETPIEGMVYPPWDRLAEGRDALRGDSQLGQEHTEVKTVSEGRDPLREDSPWQGPSEGESTAGNIFSEGRDPLWQEHTESISTVEQTLSEGKDLLRA